jgi:hypothetical protein
MLAQVSIRTKKGLVCFLMIQYVPKSFW